jgi:hypothetical protein
MSYHQHRLTVNGNVGRITNDYPGEQWERICQNSDRVTEAVWEERLVTDTDILPMLADTTGWITLDDGTVISPWEAKAELKERPGIIIIGGER